jgi:RHS repeat-associated protein
VDYFYDGKAVIEEHDASNGSLLATYRYADRLLSLNSAQGTQYYHYDGLGSTVNLTSEAGTTAVSYNLDPWGHIKAQSGSSLNRMIFTGQEHDEKTGLIYFGARFYDADTARFITQDSYLGEPGTPPSLHRYLYAYGNPTVYIDLIGYMSLDKHQEVSLNALEQAIKNGDFKMPAKGILDDIKFKANIQIGSMLPDIQYDLAADVYYLYSFKNKLQFVQAISAASEWISEKVADVKNAALKKYAPEVYMTIETERNWWDDNSVAESGIEWLAKYYPPIKENKLIRAHFYDTQWQHGMGQDSAEIREKLIENTLSRIQAYNEYVEKGDFRNAGRQLGTMMHYLEDTWTPSHTARDAEERITYMFDYSKQSPKLHGLEDKFSADSSTQSNAIQAAVALLRMIQENGNDLEQMKTILRKEIYPFAYDKKHPNPYAPRASREDALNAAKPVLNKVLKPLNTDVDKIKLELINKGKEYLNDEGGN